jgi:CubicO group peptidase (beta-lactamase class C family)
MPSRSDSGFGNEADVPFCRSCDARREDRMRRPPCPSAGRSPCWSILVGTVVLMALMGGGACSGGSNSESTSPAYWPTDGWRTSTPEEQGVDSESLLQMLDHISESNLNIHSLLIIRHGYVVLDAYFYPFAPQTKHDLASVTKSFTSTLIGIAIEKGYIKGVEQPVLDLFPGQTIANVDENKKMLTVQDLLTMRSGFECINVPTELTLQQMMQSANWVQFTLDLPMAEKPGTRFNYCSSNVHLLSGIVSQTTGMNALDFARKCLFGPLGVNDVSWPVDSQGNTYGWGNLSLTPRDLAKLGYLYLRGGEWDDQQVLDSEYAKAAIASHGSVPVDMEGTDWSYGYLWWVKDTFSAARGRGGQYLYLVPDKDIVIVVTAAESKDFAAFAENLLLSFIVPAAESETPLLANPDSAALLESRVQQAAAPPEAGSPSTLPEMARKISGRTYELPEALIRFNEKSFSLDFSGQDTALLRFGDSKEYSVGLDNAYRFMPGLYDLPAGLKGSWESDNDFVLHYDEIANVNHWKFTFTFQGEGDQVTVKEEELTGLISPPMTVEGRAY